MTTVLNNGTGYDLQIVGGVLQTRVTGEATWRSHAQMVGFVGPVHLLTPWISGQFADGSYHSTRIDDLSIFNTVNSWDYDGSLAGITPIVITNDAGTTSPPSGSGSPAPQTTHETQVSMSGHKIVDGAAGTKDRKSTRLNSSHRNTSRMPSSA